MVNAQNNKPNSRSYEGNWNELDSLRQRDLVDEFIDQLNNIYSKKYSELNSVLKLEWLCLSCKEITQSEVIKKILPKIFEKIFLRTKENSLEANITGWHRKLGCPVCFNLRCCFPIKWIEEKLVEYGTEQKERQELKARLNAFETEARIYGAECWESAKVSTVKEYLCKNGSRLRLFSLLTVPWPRTNKIGDLICCEENRYELRWYEVKSLEYLKEIPLSVEENILSEIKALMNK